jgi:hypothetical protein
MNGAHDGIDETLWPPWARLFYIRRTASLQVAIKPFPSSEPAWGLRAYLILIGPLNSLVISGVFPNHSRKRSHRYRLFPLAPFTCVAISTRTLNDLRKTGGAKPSAKPIDAGSALPAECGGLASDGSLTAHKMAIGADARWTFPDNRASIVEPGGNSSMMSRARVHARARKGARVCQSGVSHSFVIMRAWAWS